jgi:hypothetical protein
MTEEVTTIIKEKKQNFTKKEYNQRFYAKNKERLIAEACVKVTCGQCLKQITKKGLLSHQRTKLCKKQQNKNEYQAWLELKAQQVEKTE